MEPNIKNGVIMVSIVYSSKTSNINEAITITTSKVGGFSTINGCIGSGVVFTSFLTERGIRHHVLNYFFTDIPVLPNPPFPLSESDNDETTTHSALSYLAITIWAILSPLLTTKSSFPWFVTIILTSPL